MPTSAGGFIRVSTTKQDYDLQRNGILALAAHDGAEIIKWYELRGLSAYKGQQDADVQDALDDTASGRIQALYIFNSDRMERRGIEAMFALRRKFRERGGTLRSVTEPYLNQDDLGAEIGLAIAAARAREESQTKSHRQRTLVIPKLRENLAFFGRIPFGYESAGPRFSKALVPTPTGRLYVPELFCRCQDGASLRDICDWLFTLNLKQDKDGNPVHWWSTTVGDIIRHTVYVGRFQVEADGGGWIHRCEPLVDLVTFRRANEALSDRARRAQGPRGLPGKYAMLRKAIWCQRCGSPMYKHSSNGEWVPGGPGGKGHYLQGWFYYCRGSGAQQKGCGNLVPMAAADDAVNQIIETMFHVPEMARTLIPGTSYAAELEEVRLELHQLPSRNLGRKAEQAERERLWAEEDRLTSLETVPDSWKEVPTGRMYSHVFASLPIAGRGAWLAANGFAVYATKHEVTVQQGDQRMTVMLQGSASL